MAARTFKKQNLPFLLSGASELALETGDVQFNKPLDESAGAVFSASVSGSGGSKGALGQIGTVNVNVSAGTNAKLTPIFARSTGAAAKILKTYGVDGFFTGGNREKVVLAFEAGANADAKAGAAFSFAPLKAGASLEAGVSASYAYLRALDKTLKVQDLLAAYFKTMRLPEQAAEKALDPGEAISLRYGGYLKLGAEASAGFALSGSKSVSIGGLAASEKYDLNVVGRIGLAAEVAGHFSILMTAADEPGWTAVLVRRHSSKSFSVAADVNVGFKNDLDLPATADEFLGAALGVNAANFLSVLRKAQELSDFEKLRDATDGLARRFVGELIGKSFDRLESKTEFTKFLGLVNKVVTSYDQVDTRAIALFDRYFDRLHVLSGFLDDLATIEARGLATLRSRLTPDLWNILSQLTDGDPIGFLVPDVLIAGEKVDSAAELKKRATEVRALLRDEVHKEIREVVTLAKTRFGLDGFFRELAKVDTIEEIEALANDKVGEFISRLVGRTLDTVANRKEALNQIRAVLTKLSDFKEQLFKAFKDAANASYKFSLHAQYSRATERDALIDVQIRTAHARGPELLRLAGQGDFEKILTSQDTDLVRLRKGVFTHKTTRDRAFNVNIVGWHLNWKYSGFDRVITESTQRLVPSENGITVLTTMDLNVERLRRRQSEEVHVGFLLRALGESKNVVSSGNPANKAYLIDALTSLSAKYSLKFTDDDTTVSELTDYLAFAAELGLAGKGATFDQLGPMLPTDANGHFGNVEAAYSVRFGAKAIDALLGVQAITPIAELTIRKTMRRILLSNYLKGGPERHDVAFAYATDNIFRIQQQEGPEFTNSSLERVFSVDIGNPDIEAPATVTLDRFERIVLETLFQIENEVVTAIKELFALLNSGKKLSPDAFEKKLARFGGALILFDKFDQSTNQGQIGVNSIFAVFEALVRLAAKGEPANIAVLQVTSTVGERTVEKLFLSDAAAES